MNGGLTYSTICKGMNDRPLYPSLRQNLVGAWYPMLGCTGNTIPDLSNNRLTATGSSVLWNTQGIAFASSGGRCSLPLWDVPDSMTIAVTFTQASVIDVNRILFCKDATDAKGIFLGYTADVANGSAQRLSFRANKTQPVFLPSSLDSVWTNGKPHTIHVTYLAGAVTMYLDRVLAAAGTTAYPIQKPTSYPYNIGNDPNRNNGWLGTIHSVAIFSGVVPPFSDPLAPLRRRDDFEDETDLDSMIPMPLLTRGSL